MKKGVSPVVAGVILIAVAVVVGTMVSTWVTQWTSTQTSGTQSCAINTQYVVDSSKFTSATNTTTIKITNKGSEGVYGFEITVDNSTDVMRLTNLGESPSTSSTSKLTQGNSAYLTVTITGAENVTLMTTTNEISVSNTGCTSVSAKTETITQQ